MCLFFNECFAVLLLEPFSVRSTSEALVLAINICTSCKAGCRPAFKTSQGRLPVPSYPSWQALAGATHLVPQHCCLRAYSVWQGSVVSGPARAMLDWEQALDSLSSDDAAKRLHCLHQLQVCLCLETALGQADACSFPASQEYWGLTRSCVQT